MDNTFTFKVTFTVNNFATDTKTVYGTIDEALKALREVPAANGILTIDTVHNAHGVSKGTIFEYKSYAYIGGRLKTLNNNTAVLGNNYSIKSYYAKIMR